MLARGEREVSISDWAGELLGECEPIAAALDAAQGGHGHGDALARARDAVRDPRLLPSARMVAEMASAGEGGGPGGYVGLMRSLSAQAKRAVLEMPWSPALADRFAGLAAASVRRQAELEASDRMAFEDFRRHYLSNERL
jgi:glutamate--cysteine ligase